MKTFFTWLEARRENPDQLTFGWEKEPGDAVQDAQNAIARYDINTTQGMAAAAKEVSNIAKRYGLSPNELWRDVMYEPEGMAKDIEAKSEKPVPLSKPSADDAFVQHIADEFRERYGKKAKVKAKEEYQRQRERNTKHSQKMVDALEKAITLL